MDKYGPKGIKRGFEETKLLLSTGYVSTYFLLIVGTEQQHPPLGPRTIYQRCFFKASGDLYLHTHKNFAWTIWENTARGVHLSPLQAQFDKVNRIATTKSCLVILMVGSGHYGEAFVCMAVTATAVKNCFFQYTFCELHAAFWIWGIHAMMIFENTEIY